MNPNRSVVLIPCPFQGHINPMFQLADLLHKKGFPIIIVHTTFNAPDLTTYPNFRFERISENLTERETSTEDLMVLVHTLNTKCTPHFRDRLMKISEEGTPIGCIVADAIMHTTQSIADELGLRRFVLRTSCAACFAVFAAFPSLRHQGLLPIKESKLDDPVSDFPPLRVRDLPGFAKSDSTALYDFVSLVMASIRSSSGVIWNTFQELEPTWITRVRDEFKVRVFPIGPLHKQSPNVVSNSLLAVDRRCMSWLDQQKPKSVVYVSFGSLACMDPKQLVETAWGIANSGKPFLWVLRPGSVVGSGRAEVPEGFEEATRGRGLVVEWAPQREVLAHAAMKRVLE
ncbi:UDP-glycosyltransferase 76F1 [Acorus calamus]|uniref:UDP-glycosyltransferase 76F1 n=1 Tax=Acorus calamus TaxID=4465 RepID=A0AAV9EF84_ACOCL|nr:UDP-glycosyltransferase 76F1 [Acorus calamus]